MPCSLVRAPTTWSIVGSFSRIWTSSGIRSFGYVMSASVHTTISPRGPLGADPAHRARPAVAVEVDDFHLRETGRGLVQLGQRVVGGRVVDAHQLVGVAAGVHRRRDPLDLGDHVPFLVVARQDDRHIGRGLCSSRARSLRIRQSLGRLPTIDREHLGNSVPRRTEDYVFVDARVRAHDVAHRAVTKRDQLGTVGARTIGCRPAFWMARTSARTVAGRDVVARGRVRVGHHGLHAGHRHVARVP